MSNDSMAEYNRKWREDHKERLREQARQRYARLMAKPKRTSHKTYAEIAAYNRDHPVKEGWRR